MPDGNLLNWLLSNHLPKVIERENVVFFLIFLSSNKITCQRTDVFFSEIDKETYGSVTNYYEIITKNLVFFLSTKTTECLTYAYLPPFIAQRCNT